MSGGNARRMRILAVLTLLVVFVAGGLVGAAVERGRDHGRRGDRPPRAEGRRGPPPMFAEGSPLADRLELTRAQRDSIERITERDRVRADSVFGATRRAMRARFDSTMMAVDSVLTPAQRAEWQKVRQEWQAREGRGRGRRGGPGGRDGRGTPPGDGSPPPGSASPAPAQ
jgi:Spy/CpxP family protein refolding chaperone